MDKKPTAGPWHAQRGLTQMCDPVNTTVASVGPIDAQGAQWWVFSHAEDHGDSETTARLISAAPDLLEACHQALMQAEMDECTHGRKFGWGNVLRAAIAKAGVPELTVGDVLDAGPSGRTGAER